MLDAKEVKALANGQWPGIMQALAGDVLGEALERRPGSHVTCPFHGGAGDFRLDGPRARYGSFAENGGAICTCGTWKDGFALLQEARGWSFPEVVAAVGEYLGLDPKGSTRPDPRRKQRLEEARRKAAQREAARRRKQQAASKRAIAAIRRAWDEAVPLDHPKAQPARAYLASRKLTHLPLSGNEVRFHPRLICFQKGEDEKLVKLGHFPCLLGMVRNAAGEPVTLHRTYLTPGGSKLPVDKPKKLMSVPDMSTLQGGAIRLFPAGRRLGVAEGIETALAVQYATGIPCWSTLSASLLISFQPPEGVEEVIIWADRDRSGTGLKAAQKLARRLRQQGYRVLIRMPDTPIPDNAKSVDWADVWAWTGALGFPRWIPSLAHCA